MAGFLIFFVLCGVGIVYGVQHAQLPPAAPSGDPQVDPNQGPVTVRPLQPGRDGPLEFTVTEVQCGLGGTDRALANDQLCKVYVTIRNAGQSTTHFSLTGAHVDDTKGHRYDARADTDLCARGPNSFIGDLSPDISVNDPLNFDLAQVSAGQPDRVARGHELGWCDRAVDGPQSIVEA